MVAKVPDIKLLAGTCAETFRSYFVLLAGGRTKDKILLEELILDTNLLVDETYFRN